MAYLPNSTFPISPPGVQTINQAILALSAFTVDSSTTCTPATRTEAGSRSLHGMRRKISTRMDPRKLKVWMSEGRALVAELKSELKLAVNQGTPTQAMSSTKRKLRDFESRLKTLLDSIRSKSGEPYYKNRVFINFKQHLKNIHFQVRQEAQRKHISGLTGAMNLLDLIDDYENKFATLAEDAVNEPMPDVFDSTIPQLKLVNKANGLVFTHPGISTVRHDGTPLDHSPIEENLRVSTHHGTFNGIPVEIKHYFGGPDAKLTETVQEMVDIYQGVGLSDDFQKLYGGSIVRPPSDLLQGYLVLSLDEGEPWLDVVKREESIELMCQVAEQANRLIQDPKLRKYINCETFRVRSNGTLLVVPFINRTHDLYGRQVLSPFQVDNTDMDWPLRELCELLHESFTQDLVPKATAALRAHAGKWDKVAVRSIARDIGLCSPEVNSHFFHYPAPDEASD